MTQAIEEAVLCEFCNLDFKAGGHTSDCPMNKIELEADQYLIKVGSVEKKDIIRHDFIEGAKCGYSQGRDAGVEECIKKLEDGWLQEDIITVKMAQDELLKLKGN